VALRVLRRATAVSGPLRLGVITYAGSADVTG
jgi:hypothetical protein